jgi:hypothetical protein
MQLLVMKRTSRLVSGTLAAVLVLGACGSDDDAANEQPPATPAETAADQPVATTSTTEPHPDTVPPSSPPPTVPDDQLYETISSVIEDSSGPRLCFEVLESLPPQCGIGVALVDWSWDAIAVEINQNGVTWVDGIYVTGTYDDAAQTFTVDEAGLPTDDDRERILMSEPLPDFTVPCTPPEGGWPARTQEWPGEAIAALEGYAGTWSDDLGQVMTVKFTGDLHAAEAAIRERYTDGLCVVAAEHNAAELSAIEEQLRAMSSLQILSTEIHVDASGEWIKAETVAPEPERQSAFDEQFGPGVVQLRSRLQPISTS